MLQDEPYRKPLQPPFQTEADRCLRPAILKTRAVNECAKPRNFAVRITIPWQFHLINISHENLTTNLFAIRFINSQFVFFFNVGNGWFYCANNQRTNPKICQDLIFRRTLHRNPYLEDKCQIGLSRGYLCFDKMAVHGIFARSTLIWSNKSSEVW